MGVVTFSSISISVLMGLVVSFAGRIGSGKSSVSQTLAEMLEWPRVSFGDYLRAELVRRGQNPESREALQDLGQALVATGSEPFCRAVLDSGHFRPGEYLLVDGIRHVSVQNILVAMAAPSIVKLIFLAADDTQRLKRVEARAGGSSDFVRADAHRVEAELQGSLPAVADAIIDARGDLQTVTHDCLEFISQWRVGMDQR